MDLALGGCEKIPMIRSNTFFVGSWGLLPKHEKLVCQHPFFVGSCSSNPQPFQKSSGSPEVGACFFLGQMAHNQIYQIARNILPTKGEYMVNIFVKTSSIFWISTSTPTTTTKMVYQIEVLQQRGSNLISGPYKSTILLNSSKDPLEDFVENPVPKLYKMREKFRGIPEPMNLVKNPMFFDLGRLQRFFSDCSFLELDQTLFRPVTW